MGHKGYGHLVRYNDMVKRNVIPADLVARLPPASADAKAVFPSPEQQSVAVKTIADKWDSIVGADIRRK